VANAMIEARLNGTRMASQSEGSSPLDFSLIHNRRSGSVLRLSLPPEHRPKQPCTGGPQVFSHTRCHRLGHLARLIAVQAAVRPTEIVEAHRQPTHPAVIAPGWRKRQGLSGLTLVM